MGITSAIVLFAVIWWLTFFVILPMRIKTQGDLGKVLPGTHAGAPQIHHLRRKAWLTTWIALALWGAIAGTVLSGMLSISDMPALQLALPPL